MRIVTSNFGGNIHDAARTIDSMHLSSELFSLHPVGSAGVVAVFMVTDAEYKSVCEKLRVTPVEKQPAEARTEQERSPKIWNTHRCDLCGAWGSLDSVTEHCQSQHRGAAKPVLEAEFVVRTERGDLVTQLRQDAKDLRRASTCTPPTMGLERTAARMEEAADYLKALEKEKNIWEVGYHTQRQARLVLEKARSEGHAAGFAEAQKLRDCLKYAIELLEEAHSGYISGTGPDMQWDKVRDETVAEAKELLQPKEGGR